MRTLIWFIYFWAYAVAVWPKLCKADKLLKQGEIAKRDALVNDTVKPWAKGLLRLAGADISVSGLENIPKDQPVIFVSNHQGNFDIPLLLAYLDRPHGILAKMELKKIPLINRWMGHLNCVFVERENPRQSVAAMNTAVNLLSEGYSVGIFPEGTRSKGDVVGEFKSGSFKIAEKAKVPIVPLIVDGSYKLMENNKNWIKPAKVRLKVLEPIQLSGLTRQEIKLMPEQIRQLIASEKSKFS